VSDVHFKALGVDWHANARTTAIPGLDWVLVVVTRDSDFDGDLQTTLLMTLLFTALIALVATAMSLAVTN
jgi:DNA gyrase/topoisomerase IV subunit B